MTGAHFKTSEQNNPSTARGRVSHAPAIHGVQAPIPARVQPARSTSRRAAKTTGWVKKTHRVRTIISALLILVGLGLLGVAAFIFINAQLGYKEASDSYSDLEQYAVSDGSGDGVPTVDFDALAAINSDIVGWIYVPDTKINYPVVQTDDNTTYLYKLFSAEENTCGTIFMDMDNTAPGMVDQQTTIYGHHMNDGSMFKYIDDTLSQDAFDAVEHVYYITRDATYTCTPIYTMQVPETYIDARTGNFANDALFQAYLADGLTQAKAQADDAEERIETSSQVLTLITCAGEVLPRTTRACMVCSVDEVTEHVS